MITKHHLAIHNLLLLEADFSEFKERKFHVSNDYCRNQNETYPSFPLRIEVTASFET
jgi:hypothetical protein